MQQITIERARQLDRAMAALERGRITYGRWVEVLRLWVNGEDVSGIELGCETIPERIMLRFHGKTVDASTVANELNLASIDSAAVTLNRMARQRSKRAQMMARGRFKITGIICLKK